METNLTYEKLLDLFRLSDERFEKRLEERRVEFDREQEKRDRSFYKKMNEITDTLGRFATHQVLPTAVKMFRERGIDIVQSSLEVTRKDENGQHLYEVDILLHNTQYIIVIEVKSTLREADIKEHKARIKLMQEFHPKGVEGSVILGAVAAMSASEDVIRFAINEGMFAIVPSGEGVKIANPENFKPREWKLK